MYKSFCCLWYHFGREKEHYMRQIFFKKLLSRLYSTFFSVNLSNQKLELKKDSRCLVLAPHADDETIGCGGLILQNPSCFDVYCLTNGFRAVKAELSPEEKVAIRKREFTSIMEKAGINYYHFFEDVDDQRLIMRYDRFKTISLTDYDYIFIPNILEQHRDHKSVAIMLNELLKERPYKKNVKIVMYEVKTALALPNAYVDISETIDAKMDLLKMYKSQLAPKDFSEAIKGLNSYRGFTFNKKYAEAFCVIDLNDFKKLCKLYSI